MTLTTDEYIELDRRSIWHLFPRHSETRGEKFPVITRGEGVWLWDTDGHRYVDAISSWWCCNIGHGHPLVIEAIRGQARRLQHSILGNMSHPNAAVLASRLTGYFPDTNRHVLYAGDGASAVEAAMRVAVQYWHNIGKGEKHRFAAFRGAYHGDTLGAMSLGYIPEFHGSCRDIVLPVYRVKRPFCADCRKGEESGGCDLECLEELEKVLENHHEELAAVVVESLFMGAGGMRIYSPSCLRKVAALCREYEVILVADEIAAGFGRTGTMFAFEQAGVDPDIVCLGKGLSAGYLPVSAAVVKDYLFETFEDKPEDRTLYHGHTFAGNPLGVAAALACLDVYEKEDIVGQARKKGELLEREFAVFRDLDGVENVRTLGMVAAFDVTGCCDGDDGKATAQRVRRILMDEGVLLRPLGNVLYLTPPLNIGEEVLKETIRELYRAVTSVVENA